MCDVIIWKLISNCTFSIARVKILTSFKLLMAGKVENYPRRTGVYVYSSFVSLKVGWKFQEVSLLKLFFIMIRFPKNWGGFTLCYEWVGSGVSLLENVFLLVDGFSGNYSHNMECTQFECFGLIYRSIFNQ